MLGLGVALRVNHVVLGHRMSYHLKLHTEHSAAVVPGHLVSA